MREETGGRRETKKGKKREGHSMNKAYLALKIALLAFFCAFSISSPSTLPWSRNFAASALSPLSYALLAASNS